MATFGEVIPQPKRPRSLPVVLSPEEVVQFLGAVKAVKHRAILTTCYAAGLRISEALHLRVSDIDSRRMVLRVANGKGQKDRYVMLSSKLLAVLRHWWLVERPRHWLFPGAPPADADRAQSGAFACRQAASRAGLASVPVVDFLQAAARGRRPALPGIPARRQAGSSFVARCVVRSLSVCSRTAARRPCTVHLGRSPPTRGGPAQLTTSCMLAGFIISRARGQARSWRASAVPSSSPVARGLT